MDMNVQMREVRSKYDKVATRMEAIVEKAESEDRNLNEAENTEYKALEIESGALLEREDRLMRSLKVGPYSDRADKTLDLDKKDQKRYSLLRLIRSKAFPDDQRHVKAAQFELECSAEIAKVVDREPRGIYVPREVWGPRDKRTLVTATGDTGGYFVEEELRDDMFIGLLRNTSMLARAGATQLSGLRGDVLLPKHVGAGTAYWIGGEETDTTESQQTIAQVKLSPKHIAAHTRYSKQTLIQSSIGVENFVRNDLSRICGLGVDLGGLYGTGVGGQPTGLLNTTGVNKPTAFAAAIPTWVECMALVGAIAADGALPGWGGAEDPEGAMPGESVRWMMEGQMASDLMAKDKGTDTGNYILEFVGTLARIGLWEAFASNQITAGDLWFGNWADMLIGAWGDPDVIVNPFTNDTSGVIRITLHQFADIAVRHAESFGYNNDT
jgi:HK97 family phage major capsid protein